MSIINPACNPLQTAAHLIVESLVAHGIDRVFCVPGESYLGLLDALYDRTEIDVVTCRHEAGAGFMALADARLTHRPGVACVSRGPGASNAAIAVHTAQQDAVPFILLVGQVAVRDLRRDAFQEIDYGRMFGGIAKWTAEVTDPARMGEILMRAFRVAVSGTPGPVIIALPEDVLTAPSTRVAALPQPALRAAPAPADLQLMREWIGAAQRPLVLAGSGLQTNTTLLRRFVEEWNLPIVTSFRRHDLFDNGHHLYVGDMGLATPTAQLDLLQTADLLVVLGARLSDITTQGYSFPSGETPGFRLVHVHDDGAAIGTHFTTAFGLACNPGILLEHIGVPTAPPTRQADWIGRLTAERRRIATPHFSEATDGIDFERVVDCIGRALPTDAILTLDAGTFAASAYRIIPFCPPQRLLAPVAGAMGFGVPAAVAAGLRCPERTIVCMVGDGGFLMTGSELAVAAQRGLPLKVIVSVNGSYGSIRLHQERAYPGRTSGTSLANPDFELLGRAYGFSVSRIRSDADLGGLVDRLHSGAPEFVVVDTSLSAILPS